MVKLVGGSKPAQGLRLNGGKKQQILRQFKDDDSGAYIVYGKVTKGGCCVASIGKCILVGTFDENAGHTSVGCNEVVTIMAKYLNKSSWPLGSEASGGDADWQPYITNMLMNKGTVAHALICSKDDGTIWASSDGFKLQEYEVEIPQEDGSDKLETVNETKNLVKVYCTFLFSCIVMLRCELCIL